MKNTGKYALYIITAAVFALAGACENFISRRIYDNLSDPHITLLSIAGFAAGSDQDVMTEPVSGTVAAVLPQDTFIHITGIDADTKWLEVEYEKGIIGYTRNALNVTAVLSSRVGQLSAEEKVYSTVQADETLGVMGTASLVLVIEKDDTGKWYHILYDGTKTGYISADSVVLPTGIVEEVVYPEGYPANPMANSNNKALPTRPPYYNTSDHRGPDAYNNIINQFYVEANPRYAYNSGSTFAHIFNWDVMSAMGVHFPHWYLNSDKMTPYIPAVDEDYAAIIGKGYVETVTITIYDWLLEYGGRYGWTEVDSAIAQNRANNGFPVITIWKNSTGAAGHTQIVRPETAEYHYSAENGPVIAQAANTNSNYDHVRNQVYNSIYPLYFSCDH